MSLEHEDTVGRADTLDAYLLGVNEGKAGLAKSVQRMLEQSAVICRENPDDNEDYCYVISKSAYNTIKKYLELSGGDR